VKQARVLCRPMQLHDDKNKQSYLTRGGNNGLLPENRPTWEADTGISEAGAADDQDLFVNKTHLCYVFRHPSLGPCPSGLFSGSSPSVYFVAVTS